MPIYLKFGFAFETSGSASPEEIAGSFSLTPVAIFFFFRKTGKRLNIEY